MAGSDSDDSGFGDELEMTSTQTARTGSAGAGAPAALVAVGGKKTKKNGCQWDGAGAHRTHACGSHV